MLLPLLFALQSPPAIPYDRDEAWLCRPGRTDACAVDLTATIVAADGSMSVEKGPAASETPIDCFYVYPTVSEDTTAWGDMVAGEEERNVVRQQFARLASVCRPYAPLYRQITLRELRRRLARPFEAEEMSTGPGADDVRAAWEHYLRHDNRGRGVVLVGHSQGARVLAGLIRNEIEGKPTQRLLVSAILLGQAFAVPVGKDVGGTFSSVALCRRTDQVGCLVTFGSFRSNVPPAARAYFGRVPGDGMEAGCTNPAALGGGTASLDAYLTGKGRLVASGVGRPHAWAKGVPSIETPFVKVPGLLRGTCVSDANGSRLEVVVQGDTTDARADDIPGDIGAGTPMQAVWGLHLIDANLVMGDLVRLVRAQGVAYGAKR